MLVLVLMKLDLYLLPNLRPEISIADRPFSYEVEDIYPFHVAVKPDE